MSKIGGYGQVVIGPPGSGKSTYCKEMTELLKKIGRKVVLINIDPANDNVGYTADIDIAELITVEDAMKHMKLGPNGGLIYCMEYLEKNVEWLLEKMVKSGGNYFILDFPGQVELYTHHNSIKNVLSKIESKKTSLCCIHLVDSHQCNEPGKFLSTLLVTLASMLQSELPQINILSKVDLMSKFSERLPFSLEYYTEVLDLNYILDCLSDDPFTARYKKLNAAVVSLVEDYGIVSFLPLDVKDNRMLLNVKNAIDKANGYIYSINEEKNIQSLLACAVRAQFDHERIGVDRDLYTQQDTQEMES
uniref:GPN-loop GTPase 2 n=1 Tax=Gerris buenoi TaxID=56086 RepID=A0A4Q8KEX8_GERBU|nr:GPN-loop GTPase 2 [Gerris buenoi]